VYLTKFYFHPIDGRIDINLDVGPSAENMMKFFVLSKDEWKNDLSKICEKKELVLNQGINTTNLSMSFTSMNRMYFVLSNCNSSLNRSLTYKVILTNGKNLFIEHFSNDERGKKIIKI
jgi:hypothetical protein